jgi:hypothetical protein
LPAAARAQGGAVTFIQRFGDALNLNVHFHSLVLDGVYVDRGRGGAHFHPLPAPDDEEIARTVRTLARRLQRLLERRGLFEGDSADPDPLEGSVLASLADASVRGRVATGTRAGRRVLRRGDRIDPEDLRETPEPRCANVGGVSLHADVSVPARDRKRLERLCRYVARPPLATERLSRLADGRLLYRLKHRWRDGTTHIVFEPLELIEKLAALIPPPRTHLVRYHGVLAAAAPSRARVVADRDPDPARGLDVPRGLTSRAPTTPGSDPKTPSRPVPGVRTGDARHTRPHPHAGPVPTAPRSAEAPAARSATEHAPPPAIRARRLSWPELMRRVFVVDVLECPRCRGRMRMLAAIAAPEIIARILTHLGAPPRAPPAHPPNTDLLESLAPDLEPDF